MLYMIVERFRNGDPRPVYERFRNQGRMAPEGLKYVSSWVDEKLAICFQIMEAEDRASIEEWISHWDDLVEFEIYPVITSQEAAQQVLSLPVTQGREQQSLKESPIRVIRLTPEYAEQYRTMMLQAYASAPEAFTATVSEREAESMEWWNSRVSTDPDSSELVFGAFVEDRLVGVAGLRFETRERTRHKATLFGMYVLQEFARRGIGRKIVHAILDHARAVPGTRVVKLTVVESNEKALRLYESCGFVAFGTEPLANRIGSRFLSLVHMYALIP